jgi:omega-amidase
MKIGICQYNPTWQDKVKNIEQIEKLLANLEPETDCLIFPEMTLTGFTMEAKDFAEEIDGEGMVFFMQLAQKLKIEIFAGIIEKDEHKYYNSLFHFNALGLIQAVYRKIHPFSLSEEDLNYSPGNEIVVTNINKTKIGLTICYDLRFPELYRLYAKKHSEIIIDIANWPIKRIDHWKTLLKARAIENQCFIIGVNRIGNDSYHEYNGCSAVFTPMGEELVCAENVEKIIYCEINLDEVKYVREKLPFLKDIKLI